MVPPFGACGSTYSKFLKPGGYFSSPKSDRPWLPAAAMAATRPKEAASPPLNMVGLVAYTVADASEAQGRQRIGAPLKVVGRPLAPIQRSREIGWSMIPRKGRP